MAVGFPLSPQNTSLNNPLSLLPLKRLHLHQASHGLQPLLQAAATFSPTSARSQ
jgi:hypothetical protein